MGCKYKDKMEKVYEKYEEKKLTPEKIVYSAEDDVKKALKYNLE